MKNVAMGSADFTSQVWKNHLKNVEARLLELRGQLEQLDATPDQTSSLRGRISELKAQIQLGNVTNPSPSKQRLARSLVSEPLGS